MSLVAFRFDIDTHKCIRDGVGNLLTISRKYHAPFTFFLNTGRAIDLKDSVSTMLHPSSEKTAPHLSAKTKLGNQDYLICAVCNPPLMNYKKQIGALLNSKCEIGIHGGRNHALWTRNFSRWSAQKISEELEFAIDNLRQMNPTYRLGGFASPCWTSEQFFLTILRQKGFRYSADFHEYGTDHLVREDGALPVIGVNLLGEPGGVAWFETCVAQGLSTAEIVRRTMDFIDEHPLTVLYDHPYFAGCDSRAIQAIEKIIIEIQQRGHKLITLGTLLP